MYIYTLGLECWSCLLDKVQGSRAGQALQCTAIAIWRGLLKCDGTRAESTFRLSAKRTSLFKSAGPSVQSTTGSRGVRISGSNVGYTMF